ncbi:hypothetical protein Btru_058072 [Bulinus truncatus]|nr:hypothetical protein Btru_058072 [Bulinus truncatus]
MLNKKKATKAKEEYSKKLQDSSNTSGEKSSGNESERIFPFSEQRLYVINKSGTGDVSYLLVKENFSAVLSYRVHADKWQQTVDLVDFGVVTLGKYIYVIGGFHKLRKVCVDRVMRFDPATATWTECCCLLAARSKFGVCTLRGKIYVCGGEKDGGKTTASCEMYDPETNSWTKCGMLCCSLVLAQPALPMVTPSFVPEGVTTKKRTIISGFMKDTSGRRWTNTTLSDYRTVYRGASSRMQKGLDNAGEETPLEMALTERRMFSCNTEVSAGRRPVGAATGHDHALELQVTSLALCQTKCRRGQNIHVIGGTTVESGDTATVPERFDLVRRKWTRGTPLKNCDVSQRELLSHGSPKVLMSERKLMQNRLNWVMWCVDMASHVK